MQMFDEGADKRRHYGCKGAQVFRDPNEDDQVWVIFDWDEQGWKSFVSDPEVPGIMQEAGHKGKPQVAALGARLDAYTPPLGAPKGRSGRRTRRQLAIGIEIGELS